MPEGDTVWLAAERLRAALTGAQILASDFRVPRLATADLSGRTVLDVVPRGKHLLTRVSGDVTLHTHFRMDGSWHLYAPGQPWGGPAHQVRVVLATAEHVAVGFRLHDVRLVSTLDEDRLVGHLGPDVLGPDWSEEEATRRLLADPDREVGPALLDQRVLAGVGNLYKTETCFLRGITPWTRVGDLDDAAALVRLARRLMLANRGRWEQATTGDTRAGQEHWVFERSGRPCRRCGSRVVSATQAVAGREEEGRLSYWCPRCQRGPAPPPDPPVRRGPRPRLAH